MSTGSKGGFRCENCSRVYSQNYILTRHLKYECGQAPRFSCTVCSKRFKRKSVLTEHLKYIHGFNGVVSRLRSFISFLVFQLPQTYLIFCDSPCVADGLGSVNPTYHQCPDCNRNFTLASSLKRHLDFSCGQSPRFACQLCSKKFRRKDYLNEHLAKKHGVKKAYFYMESNK
ncbi:hypothetical protein J6590_002380 [Homalodisca vitripennis]|nr:hypothetical protein J6590_002380 [Homalodisca vitripennis]